MDGLLVDSETLTHRVLNDKLAEFGKSMSVAFYVGLIGQSNETADAYIAETFPELPHAHNFLNAEFERRVRNSGLDPKPGAAELLDWLDERGIAKSVVSSNIRSACDLSLTSAGFTGRFDYVVNADLVDHCKPAPDLFLKALELYGAAPHECLVLEDSEAGILAANAAGIPVIMVPDLLPPDARLRALCLAVCDSLTDVIPYLS